MNKQTIETLLNLGKLFQDNNIPCGVTGSFALNLKCQTPADVDLYIPQHSTNYLILDTVGKRLADLGFKSASREETEYEDKITLGVWRNSQALIDIQVVKDFDIKTKAQEILFELPLSFISSSPSTIRGLWNWAIKRVEEFEELKSKLPSQSIDPSIIPDKSKYSECSQRITEPYLDEFGSPI